MVGMLEERMFMSEMKCIMYFSEASPRYRDSDLDEILRTTRARNAEQGITGILFFNERHFFAIF